MEKRFPRPEPIMVKRFPRSEALFTSDELKDATKKNGSVDLNKIRQVVSKRAQEKKKIAQKALDTKKEHDERFAAFMSVYREHMDAEFIPITKKRYVSYKNKEDMQITRRYKTDRTRFIEFYSKVKRKYGENNWNDKWLHYIEQALHLAIEVYEFSEQTKIFGVIVSDKVSEKVFTDMLREDRRKQRKVERLDQRNRHARLFNKNE
jgi:hypothetical protein